MLSSVGLRRLPFPANTAGLLCQLTDLERPFRFRLRTFIRIFSPAVVLAGKPSQTLSRAIVHAAFRKRAQLFGPASIFRCAFHRGPTPGGMTRSRFNPGFCNKIIPGAAKERSHDAETSSAWQALRDDLHDRSTVSPLYRAGRAARRVRQRPSPVRAWSSRPARCGRGICGAADPALRKPSPPSARRPAGERLRWR